MAIKPILAKIQSLADAEDSETFTKHPLVGLRLGAASAVDKVEVDPDDRLHNLTRHYVIVHNVKGRDVSIADIGKLIQEIYRMYGDVHPNLNVDNDMSKIVINFYGPLLPEEHKQQVEMSQHALPNPMEPNLADEQEAGYDVGPAYGD